MSSRTPTRVQLGAAAVFSVAEAVALLPGRDGDERAWLQARGLIRERWIPGRPEPSEYVLWAEVLRELGAEEAERRVETPARPPATSIRRRAF